MNDKRWPLAPLFWFAMIILVIQSVVFYAGELNRKDDSPSWSLYLLIGVGVVVAAVCFLLVWRWKLWIPALLLAGGTGVAYIGILGWVFGAILVVAGIVVSLKSASPTGKVEFREVNWESDKDGGAALGPITLLVTLAILVIGIELVLGLLWADDIETVTEPGLIEDPFRSRLILICAGLLVVIGAAYAIAYRAWLSGLCMLIAAIGAVLGFFIMVPTSAFALLAIALSFVRPAKGEFAGGGGKEIVVQAD